MAGGTLRERTLYLLRERPRHMTYVKMAEQLTEHDGTITANWLALFASNRLQTIDVDKVQIIYEFLTKTKLELI